MITTFLLSLLSATGSVQDDPTREELIALMQRCGEEVTWHQEWESAAAAARAKSGLVLVVHQAQGGYEMPDVARIGPFMDQDIVELVRQRFEVFEFAQGKQAPFVAQDRYGVGPFSFGASILVADTEGNILDTTGDMGGSFYPLLVRNVGRLDVGTPPENLGPAERASWHLRRGELEAARVLLAFPETAEEHRLAGSLQRLSMRGEEALTAFRNAIAMGGNEMSADVATETAAVLLGLERRTLARATLGQVPEDHRDWHQALFLLGAIDVADGDSKAGLERWRTIIQAAPESRWAWHSAAMTVVNPLMQRLGGSASLAWPSAESLDMTRARPWAPLPATRLDYAEGTARDYLLATQRADGSWPSTMSGARERSVDAFVIGVTSWAGRALLAHLDEPRCEAAIQRAAAFLRASRPRLEELGEPPGSMDYFVWCKPSLLLFGAEGIEAGVLDEDEWIPILTQVVAELRAKQRKGGGWHYYKGFDLENLDDSLEMSASFVTAFALHALKSAEEIGADVPEEMVAGAIRCLEACSNDDGTFEYTLVHAAENGPRRMTPSGAAGRGPLCTLALYRWDRAGLDSVKRSLESFVEHRAAFAREHGKTLMHCGLEAEGSHYLMFDYAWCAAAFDALDEADRGALRRPLIDQILGARTDAGGYLDNPLIGDRFGTAAALWAFPRLRPAKEPTQD